MSFRSGSLIFGEFGNHLFWTPSSTLLVLGAAANGAERRVVFDFNSYMPHLTFLLLRGFLNERSECLKRAQRAFAPCALVRAILSLVAELYGTLEV